MPGKVPHDEPLVNRVVADIHEPELERRFRFNAVADHLAQDRFMTLDVWPQFLSPAGQWVVAAEHDHVVGVTAHLDRRPARPGKPCNLRSGRAVEQEQDGSRQPEEAHMPV